MPEDVPYETELARLHMQQDMEAARQISQMKQTTMRGKTFKVRWSDRTMEPAIQVNDVLEVGPFVLMQLKAGDLVYYRMRDTFFVRRVARRTAAGQDLAFAVRTESAPEEEIVPGNQVLGKVVSLTRGSQEIVFDRGGGAGLKLDVETILSRLTPVVNHVLERIQDLVARIRRK